jgi:hypothetical protein
VPRFDAILIPGGGVREGGVLPPWSVQRFERALELQSGEPLVCLSAATTHRPPPLDAGGFPIYESTAGARYLMERGIAPEQIRMETVSLDTIGNAYFSKLIHVDPAGWIRLVIVTSEFHMPRTEAVFRWVYGMGPGTYELQFESSADTGMDEDLLQARRAKESEGLKGLLELAQTVRRREELHEWVFTRHAAYKASAGLCRNRLDDRVLRSY